MEHNCSSHGTWEVEKETEAWDKLEPPRQACSDPFLQLGSISGVSITPSNAIK
jgi:hypothetical protein